jgi:hypothetical protein
VILVKASSGALDPTVGVGRGKHTVDSRCHIGLSPHQEGCGSSQPFRNFVLEPDPFPERESGKEKPLLNGMFGKKQWTGL